MNIVITLDKSLLKITSCTIESEVPTERICESLPIEISCSHCWENFKMNIFITEPEDLTEQSVEVDIEQFDPLGSPINLDDSDSESEGCDKKSIKFAPKAKPIETAPKMIDPIQLSCEACGKLFNSRKYLQSHLASVHYSTDFSCDLCDKSFRAKASLEHHMKITHTEMVPTFECKLCSPRTKGKYKTQKQLTQHMRAVHPADKFKCKLCSSSYKQKASLNIHMRKHTNERRFGCKVCGKRFITNTVLKAHVITHSQDMRSFVCPLCPAKFFRKTSLSVHQKIHEDLKRKKAAKKEVEEYMTLSDVWV